MILFILIKLFICNPNHCFMSSANYCVSERILNDSEWNHILIDIKIKALLEIGLIYQLILLTSSGHEGEKTSPCISVSMCLIDR